MNTRASLELTSTITALASVIASGLTADEIGLIASIFVQLGDTLTTVAAYENLRADREGTVG